MTTRLIIVRHGNTFGPNDTPTRVGARTDLPLVETGREQSKKIGLYLKEHNLLPDVVFTSTLKRTREMADIILDVIGIPVETHALNLFDEIDYGPDENKTEDDVIARIGADAINAWDHDAVVPDGWVVDPGAIIRNWQDFANGLEEGSTALVITSNGIARFAPHILLEGFETFRSRQKIKIATGALCLFKRPSSGWECSQWNIRP